jgi:DNA-binding response OmpR family regulator
MNEVLLVEATEELQPLARALEQAGYALAAATAEEARRRLAEGERFTAAVVNLVDAAPEASVRGMLASSTGEAATIAIVRREELPGLDPDLPVDDFVALPAAPEELVARLRRALRRRHGQDDPNVLRRGDLVIDHASYRVHIGTRPVELTYKEYELLRFLALNEGKVCTREMLLSRVWGYDFYGGARTVDVHIRRLRSKIEDRHHTLIETVRNVGYRFRAG